MVEAAGIAADGCRKRMALNIGAVIRVVVNGIVERFADDIPLEGDIRGAAGGEALVRRPGDRAVIDNGIGAGAKPHAAGRFAVHLADTHAHITDDNILSTQRAEIVVDECDAVAGRCLSRDIHIAAVLGDAEHRFQRDHAADIEDNGARTLEGLETVAEGALAAVIEIRHMVDRAASAAAGISAVALRGRKGKAGDLEGIDSALCDGTAADLIHTPVVGRDRGIGLIERILRAALIALEFRGCRCCTEHGIIACADIDIVRLCIFARCPRKHAGFQMLLLIRRRDAGNAVHGICAVELKAVQPCNIHSAAALGRDQDRDRAALPCDIGDARIVLIRHIRRALDARQHLLPVDGNAEIAVCIAVGVAVPHLERMAAV